MIAREGSMNKAAEALYISQPALTSAIKELERESGLSIFLRIGTGKIQGERLDIEITSLEYDGTIICNRQDFI